MQETGFDPWVWKIPWRRKWQPTPVRLPGKFHGLRSLVGYSPVHGVAKSQTRLRDFTFTFDNRSISIHEKLFSCEKNGVELKSIDLEGYESIHKYMYQSYGRNKVYFRIIRLE